MTTKALRHASQTYSPSVRRPLRYIALFVILAVSVFGLSAQSVSLQVSNQVIQGNKFTVAVKITNGDGTVTKDMAPKIQGCTYLYGPAISTMQSVQIINGRQSSSASTNYTFTYKADKAGNATIPTIQVVVDGKKMSTKPKTITILPPDQARQRQNPYYDPFDDFFAEPEPAPTPNKNSAPAISAKDFIITVNLSKQSVYEKEAVIATIKLYTKHNITRFQPKVMPQFEGFLSEELPVSQQTAQREHFRGDNYYTIVLKKCLLYPTKSGKLTINSGQYDVTLETIEYVSNGFFATPVPHERSMVTTSNSVSINVKPLPQPAPSGFNGAVGSFKASTTLTPERLRTNEAATYTFTLTGTGNLKHLSEPVIPFPSTVEEYTPQAESDVNFNGSNMQGSFTATYTIVPQEIGKVEIPAWQFTYFDPSTGKYVTTELPAYDRDIAKGIASASSSGAKENLDTETIRDIRHITRIDESELDLDRTLLFESIIYRLTYVIAIILLLTAVIIYRRYIKSAADVEGRRTRRAHSVAAARLRKASTAMKAHDNDAFYASVSAAIWGYLSDKLKMPASALTRENVAEKLSTAGADDDLVNRTIDVLDECEAARFTPNHTESEIANIYNDASAIIDNVERIKVQKAPRKTETNTSVYGDNM